MPAKDIDKDSIEDFIGSGRKIVYFWSDLCGPCHVVGPQVEEIAESKSISLGKVNTEDEEEIAESFSVRSLPTIILFEEGKEIDRIVGYVSKKDIEKKLDSFLGE